ncbi:MAG: 3-hydroxyacyl-CoA dehydrogenase [Deltaproteobacteria bacterium]|nr:3-hydroxyacyl-CoA dehydrogenase [Deltaproteobacteria bacterium]
MEEIKTVCIVGPGRMGIGIATALLAGRPELRVVLLDVKDRDPGRENEALERARAEVERNLILLKDLGELAGNPTERMEGLALTRDANEHLKSCGVVFEALPEQPDLKQAFLRNTEGAFERSAIIASSTSTIHLSTFCEAARHPERIVIAHWLNPAFIIPLVEVATGDATAPWASEGILRFLTEMGKIPVELRDSAGFIVPRIQVAAMNEAVRIVEEGVAGPETVDTAIKAGFGFRLAVLGLVEFIDLGGLDILYNASRYLYGELGLEQYRPLPSVTEKMERGEVGPRSGKGYYDYTGVDTDAMFLDRYRGFVELLNLVRRSRHLDFRGGIRDRSAADPTR